MFSVRRFSFRSPSVIPMCMFLRHLLILRSLGILYCFESNCYLKVTRYFLYSYRCVWFGRMILFSLRLFIVYVGFLVQLYPIFTVLLLNILCRMLDQLKCLCMSLMNIPLIIVFTFSLRLVEP